MPQRRTSPPPRSRASSTPASRAGQPVARTKVWVERDGVVLMSDYRARLLEAVDARGSVAAGAQALRLPYRTAWKKLREMEEAAGVPLLESDSGGAGGGQSRLTPAAREMVASFRRLSAPAVEDVSARFPDEANHFEVGAQPDGGAQPSGPDA
ncbi:MAG: LysR family transcriptional regulator [Dehalococcoidia bacterium]|nr:LysR family transcriptional regulator [Dehalococcoidia bacterium]